MRCYVGVFVVFLHEGTPKYSKVKVLYSKEVTNIFHNNSCSPHLNKIIHSTMTSVTVGQLATTVDLVNALDAWGTNHQKILTEKGGVQHASSSSGRIDFVLHSTRGHDCAELFHMLMQDFDTSSHFTDQCVVVQDIFTLVFHLRATRDGKGEKALFHKLFVLLHESLEKNVFFSRFSLTNQLTLDLVKYIPAYGCYKDLKVIIDSICPAKHKSAKTFHSFANANLLVQECVRQLVEGFRAENQLAFKWAPKQRQKQYKYMVDYVAETFFGEPHREDVVVELTSEDVPSGATIIRLRNLEGLVNGMFVQNVGIDSDTTIANILEKESAIVLSKPVSGFIGKWESTVRFVPKERYGIRSRYRQARQKAMGSVVEVLASDDKWHAISPGKVPSKCMNKWYAAALFNANQTKNKQQAKELLLQHIRDGAKLNAGAVDPHEILKGKIPVVNEAQWEPLVEKYVELARSSETFRPFVPCLDVSGSMEWDGGLPLEVCIAFGILLSEVNEKLGFALGGRAITFSDKPQWFTLKGTLSQRIDQIRNSDGIGTSTQFHLAWERILDAVRELSERGVNLDAYELPGLFVISDMQFDEADSGYFNDENGTTGYSKMQQRFAEVGIELRGKPFDAPPLVFWNVRGTTGAPVLLDTANVQLMSGYSFSLFERVVFGVDEAKKYDKEKPTPFTTMRATCDHPVFVPVRDIVNKHLYQHSEEASTKASIVKIVEDLVEKVTI